MRKTLRLTALSALLLGVVFAQKKLTLQDLPPAVQKTIQGELKGGDIKNIDSSVDFGVPATYQALSRHLAAFAQVKEVDHAPAVPDDLGIPLARLNTKHIVASSYLGCAHFLADQWEHPRSVASFDAARMNVVQHKYFVAFLAALAQRVVMHRLLLETVDSTKSDQVMRLWKQFSAFEAASCLIDISRREAVNRFYRVCQASQRVSELAAMLHRVLTDSHSNLLLEKHQMSLSQQEETLEQQRLILIEQRETESRLSVIEVFVVTVYTAELVHGIGAEAEFMHSFILTGILGLSTLAFLGCAAARESRSRGE